MKLMSINWFSVIKIILLEFDSNWECSNSIYSHLCLSIVSNWIQTAICAFKSTLVIYIRIKLHNLTHCIILLSELVLIPRRRWAHRHLRKSKVILLSKLIRTQQWGCFIIVFHIFLILSECLLCLIRKLCKLLSCSHCLHLSCWSLLCWSVFWLVLIIHHWHWLVILFKLFLQHTLRLFLKRNL
jgi:hypothetical protein